MPTQLLLAPLGAGKTQRALTALVDTLQEDSFARIWVLLPSRRQEDAFRQRLLDFDPTRRVYFNVEFFDFYKLYAYLLDIAGNPQRQLDNTARLRLLREILADLNASHELEIYGQIADKPGFVEIVADFIYELKQNVIYPDAFRAAARSPKDRDLANIYDAYQDKLRQYDLVDREGEGWLALEAAQNDPTLGMNVSLLLVHGFDQFNPLQSRLLALLSSYADNALITLPTVPLRENTVGRRFQEAYNGLRVAFDEIGEPVEELKVMPLSEFRRSALQHLVETSFLPLSPEANPPSSGALLFLEAPDPGQEAAAVLRGVKRLLLTNQCQPDDILIAVRDWVRYASHFAALGRSFKIPVSLHFGEPLSSNPALIALLNLLELPGTDFRRRDLLDVLRSPYFAVPGLDNQAVDLLERISQKQLVISGRDEWLDAIQRSAMPSPADEDEDDESPLLDISQAEHLAYYLNTFFEAITPLSQATVSQYVAWLENLIGADITDPDEDDAHIEPPYNLQLFPRLRAPDVSESLVSRDLSAMYTFKRLLRSLLSAQNLFSALGMSDKIVQDWSVFLTDLKTALGSAAVNRDANRIGKVLITSITDARGLPHRHIFIPGLSEGIFPAPTPEDPLYLDSEREALQGRGIYLETSAERAADEGLFYELISQARDSLTLSRPTVQNGVLWPESHLWRAARDVFADSAEIITANRIPLGGVVRPDDVAAPGEVVLSAADSLSRNQSDAASLQLYNWIVAPGDSRWGSIRDQWLHILRGRQIEGARMDGRAADHYSGRLRDENLVAYAAAQLGAGRVWSASQFNEYGTCGFRFFAKRLLKLETLKEPEDGMDAMQRGTLIHAILEETYRRLADGNISIAPENLDTARAFLHDCADAELLEAPAKLGFRASPLWEQEKVSLLRKLEKMLESDFLKAGPAKKTFGDDARIPYRLESPFSDAQDNAIDIQIADGLEPLRVTGYIDRIDRQGDRVIVVDYKSGSTPILVSEMGRGRNYQMMLYLLAVQQILAADPDPNRPTHVAGGYFWHLSDNKATGVFNTMNPEHQEAMQSAAQHLADQIGAGRVGDFAVHPNKTQEGRCHKNCEFSQLCRISLSNRGK
ncbi:MAG: PD-(D/E)XK nuclease family protein [Chloroflexota bacterium]